MANKFIGFLETVGKDFEKGLEDAVKLAPSVGTLISSIIPSSAPEVGLVSTAVNLIQNSIMAIEQKYAASGVQSGTGTQKAAEVLTLVGPAATALLTEAKVPNVTSEYIQTIIDAIVGVLNMTQPQGTGTPAVA